MQWYLNFYQFCYRKLFKWPSISQVLGYFPPLKRFCWPEFNIPIILSPSKFIPSEYCTPDGSHAVCVSLTPVEDIDLMHQGQFLSPDLQIQTNCSLTHDK